MLPEEMDLDILYEERGCHSDQQTERHGGASVSGKIFGNAGERASGPLPGQPFRVSTGVLRPGIVHRIDKDTTGVLVVCKTDLAHRSLAEQLKEHSITRKYEAIVYNNIPEERKGRWDAPIGRNPSDRKKMAVEYKNGKRAVTHYRVIDHLNHQFNHIEMSAGDGAYSSDQGFTMASIGHPLLGDEIYGPRNGRKGLEGQCLHARVLGFCPSEDRRVHGI